MSKLSAGLLLFRRADDGIEVLIAHPGGPIWSRRDAGAWSLPKGATMDHETTLLETARREFHEETGHPAPDSEVFDLGEVRMRSGKVVHGYALEGDLDPRTLRSMQIEIEWPPRSGRVLRVPEIDRVLWAGPAEARRRLNTAQASFVDRLLSALDRP
jgi:predicted NUDIX family NTP pyrophosphohydrolase